MNTQDKVTSRGLSGKIKAAGAVQGVSALVYSDEFGGLVSQYIKGDGEQYWPLGSLDAFDCAELLEMLKAVPVVRLYSNAGGGWTVEAFERDGKGGQVFFHGTASYDAAEALGKLYLWCLENGHVERNKP